MKFTMNRSLLMVSFFVIAYTNCDNGQAQSLYKKTTIEAEDLAEFVAAYKLCSDRHHPTYPGYPSPKLPSGFFVADDETKPYATSCQEFVEKKAVNGKIMDVIDEFHVVHPVVCIEGEVSIPQEVSTYHEKLSGENFKITPFIFALYRTSEPSDNELMARIYASIVDDGNKKIGILNATNLRGYWDATETSSNALLLKAIHAELKRRGCQHVEQYVSRMETNSFYTSQGYKGWGIGNVFHLSDNSSEVPAK